MGGGRHPRPGGVPRRARRGVDRRGRAASTRRSAHHPVACAYDVRSPGARASPTDVYGRARPPADENDLDAVLAAVVGLGRLVRTQRDVDPLEGLLVDEGPEVEVEHEEEMMEGKVRACERPPRKADAGCRDGIGAVTRLVDLGFSAGRRPRTPTVAAGTCQRRRARSAERGDARTPAKETGPWLRQRRPSATGVAGVRARRPHPTRLLAGRAGRVARNEAVHRDRSRSSHGQVRLWGGRWRRTSAANSVTPLASRAASRAGTSRGGRR